MSMYLIGSLEEVEKLPTSLTKKHLKMVGLVGIDIKDKDGAITELWVTEEGDTYFVTIVAHFIGIENPRPVWKRVIIQEVSGSASFGDVSYTLKFGESIEDELAKVFDF